MEEPKQIYCKSSKEWRTWLEKNHLKEKTIALIKYKKHTGKPSLFGNQAMMDAICYGWIDTTVKKLDEEKYIQRFAKRNEKSKWSINTLKYGKDLFEKGLMSEYGIKMYKEGLAKKPHDADIPLNPETPEDLKKELGKHKLKEKFETIAPSTKRMFLRWLFRAKQAETREKRIGQIINLVKENKKLTN